MKKLETQVLIIGAGVVGTGLARDLALRGVEVVVAERRGFGAGASGANHGLLHSGARYVATDPKAAADCLEESRLIRTLAPHWVEDCGGLFVALPGDDQGYVSDFPELCRRCGIEAQPLEPREARELEPGLARDIVAAFRVPDAAVNPFLILGDNLAGAVEKGGVYLDQTEVVGFRKGPAGLEAALLRNHRTGLETEVRAAQVVNAAGPWVGNVAGLAGVALRPVLSKGSLLVAPAGLTRGVVNRLRPPGDGDIFVPAGEFTVLGTTSVRITDPDPARPEQAEIDLLFREGSALIPGLRQNPPLAVYAGVRPLSGSGERGMGKGTGRGDDRRISRDISLLDHTDAGSPNLTTILGGKLTTFRLTAQRAADLMVARLVRAGKGGFGPCLTRIRPVRPAPLREHPTWPPGMARS